MISIYLRAKFGCATPVKGVLQTKKQTDRQTDRQRLSVSHTSLFKSKVGFNPTLLKKPVLSLPFKVMAARARISGACMLLRCRNPDYRNIRATEYFT